MGESVQYTITKEELRNITEWAAQTGAKAYRAEIEAVSKERKEKLLHNAKVLLKNYRRLKKHVEKAMYDKNTVDDNELIRVIDTLEWYNLSPNARSIEKGKAQSEVIMRHIDAMIMAYREQCETASDPDEARRYRIIEAMHIQDNQLSADKIAELENIDRSTVFRDANKAYEKLAVLMFGINGLKF